jgi:O-antigen ligase
VFAAGFAVMGGPGLLVKRVQETNALEGRWAIFQSSAAMLLERPWRGFGLGTFEDAYPAYAIRDFGSTVNHVHNDWLEWGCEGGTPLLLLTLAGGVWVSVYAVRSIWALGILAVLGHSLTDFPLHTDALLLWASVMAGALSARSDSRWPKAIERATGSG